MNIETKSKLANLSMGLILTTVIIVVLFFFGYILSSAFDLKVFASRTSDFIITLSVASIVIVVCGAFLNISLNIGIIAESKMREYPEIDKGKSSNKRLWLWIMLTFITIAGLLFIGDFATRQNEKSKMLAIGEQVLKRHSRSVDDIGTSLETKTNIEEIPEILKFLSEQEKELPSVTLITAETYKMQLCLLEVNSYTQAEDMTKKLFNYSFYSSDQDDNQYLREVFESNRSTSLFISKENNYRLYYPVVKGKKKFVLLFSQYNRYGKVGS